MFSLVFIRTLSQFSFLLAMFRKNRKSFITTTLILRVLIPLLFRLISERTVEENILKKANQKRMLGDMAIEGGNFTTAFFKEVLTPVLLLDFITYLDLFLIVLIFFLLANHQGAV